MSAAKPTVFWRNIPVVWKRSALNGFHGVDATEIVLGEKDAAPVFLVGEGQSLAVGGQLGALVYELLNAHAKGVGDGRNFRLAEAYLPRPAATGTAAFTMKMSSFVHVSKRRVQEMSSPDGIRTCHSTGSSLPALARGF